MSVESGFSQEQIQTRQKEIDKVTNMYGFTSVHELMLPPAMLETLPKGNVIGPILSVVNEIEPDEVYTVFRNDAHSDHEIVYDAVMSATKSFRHPFIKRVLAYETMSETDFGMKPGDSGFSPNVFINISAHLDKKLDILEEFKSEIGEFPFPRSRKALESLAFVRGVQANCNAAEAFMLLKEIQ